MSRALLRAACATLLLVGGFFLYLLFAYAMKRPPEADAALELRQALTVYGWLVILRGLLPTLWLTLPLAALLERALPAWTRSRGGALALLAIAASLAAVLVAATLLPLALPNAPRVVFRDSWNFVATWLEMTAGVVAAVLVTRWLFARLPAAGPRPA